ncbi:MAG TPA: TolC family protein [Tepidisphaeraceae bacterium]|nr:TolC family protein [Tepidisphaeraceae bacterium]
MRVRWWLYFISTACLAGCQRYEPMPLAAPALQEAIATQPADQLQASVDRLDHPTLLPVTIDFEHGLTPDAAAVVAVITNPSLRALRDQHCLASAQLLQASLLPNPTLDAAIDPVTGGNTVGTVTGYSIGPSWEVTSLITHEAKVAAARAGTESARLDVAWQEWQIALAAKKAAYDLIFLAAQRDALAGVEHSLARNLAIIQSAVQSHDRTMVDLAAAQAAHDKAAVDSLAAQHDVHQQELALNRALGFKPDAAVKLAPMAILPSEASLPAENELVRRLEDRRLDLLALRHGYDAQEEALRVAVLSQFPKIVIGFHQARDTTNVQSSGFGVTVDLPIFDQQQGAIAIEKATRQKLFDEYAARLFDARADIAQSIAGIHSLTRQIAAGEIAVTSLQRLVKTYNAAAAGHNLDILSAYAAENDLAQKQVEILKLKQQLLDNEIALELASGAFISSRRPAGARGGPTTQPATIPSTGEAKQ